MWNFLNLEKVQLFLGVFFGMCMVIVGAIMMDLWDGVYTAKVTKVKVHSHKLRVTIEKMSEYWRFCAIGFLIDCIGMIFTWYDLPFLAIIFGVGLVCVEIKSMFEHAKKRKSSTMDLPKLLKSIQDATTKKDAQAILDFITSRHADIESENENKSVTTN